MYFLVLVICIFYCSCCKALYSESIYLNKYSALNVTKYLYLHFKYTLHDVRSQIRVHRKLAPKVIPSNNFPGIIKAKADNRSVGSIRFSATKHNFQYRLQHSICISTGVEQEPVRQGINIFCNTLCPLSLSNCAHMHWLVSVCW